MSGWNQAPLSRDRILLFRETLGDRIPADHSVRLMAEILDELNWSSRERGYVLVAGQPPIHPKIVAGAVLYGLTHGIRSSRRLEWACGHAVDFMEQMQATTWPPHIQMPADSVPHPRLDGRVSRYSTSGEGTISRTGLTAPSSP